MLGKQRGNGRPLTDVGFKPSTQPPLAGRLHVAGFDWIRLGIYDALVQLVGLYCCYGVLAVSYRMLQVYSYLKSMSLSTKAR